jgi:hypothetical protein
MFQSTALKADNVKHKKSTPSLKKSARKFQIVYGVRFLMGDRNRQHANLPWGPLSLGAGSEKESQASALHSGIFGNKSELKRKIYKF